MFRRFILTLALVFTGALGSLGSRALAAPLTGPDATECGSCLAGIGIWNEVFNVVDSNGNPCTMTTIWWRKNGTCTLVGEECVEELACRYLVQTNSTCDNANSEFLVQVSSPGGLNFSTYAIGAKVVGAPFCGWSTQFSTCVVNFITGAVWCRTNYASCGACPGGGEPPDGSDDATDGGKG